MTRSKILPLSALNTACEEQLEKVRAEWPDGIPLTTETVDRVLALDLDVEWAAYKLLTAAALAEYERVTDAALAEYERVTDAALAEYERVKAAALAEYERVKAAALLRILLTSRREDCLIEAQEEEDK